MNKIAYLEGITDKYDIILLLPEGVQEESTEALNEALRQTDKKVLVLTEDTEEIVQLYRTYEFSDNIQVINKGMTVSANIFNLVKTGLLQEKEAWQALLG